MDGSRRFTQRNRRFLRKIAPVCSDPPLRLRKSDALQRMDDISQPINQTRGQTSDIPLTTNVETSIPRNTSIDNENETVQVQNIAPSPTLRRSSRIRQPREFIVINPQGKSHSYENP